MRQVMRILASVALALLCARDVRGQVHVGQIVPDTPPGGTFSLTGDNLTSKRWEVTFNRAGAVSAPALPTALEATKITFVVPAALAPNPYLLFVKENDGNPVYVGTITVTAPPKVETTPKINYTLATAGWIKLWSIPSQFDFDIYGDRLKVSKDLTLALDTQRLVLKPCPASNTLTDDTQTAPCYVSVDAQRLSIHGIPTGAYRGPHNVSVVTENGQSNDDKKVRVSRITPRMIKWLSFVCLCILVLLLLLIGKDGFSAAAGSTRNRFFSWVLLDPQTNTFSLSKLQFLMWMLTIAYCYVFLQLALVFAQGDVKLAPLPEKFGWLIGVTGGTVLTSIMLTRSRGPKGAGDAGPALSDLVASGGVLAPDRAQLLIWTLIGCSGYVLIVLRTSTEALKNLPEVPADLLAAMGISAAVYAGGKSVRLPGPVINQVTAGTDGKTLTVKGQNLHLNALVSLDLQPADVKITGTPTPNAASENFSSELTLPFTALPSDNEDHALRVTNLDGQYAEAWFAVKPPTVDKVVVGSGAADAVPAGSAEIELTLTGTGFRLGSTAEWLPTGQTSPTIIGTTKVTVTSDTAAKVTLAPGTTKGGATLTLISPHSIRASRRVTVA